MITVNEMIEHQLKARGIVAPLLLDAMRSIPREHFVPVELKNEAYTDGPLQVGFGQTISQPYIVASMIEHLAPYGGKVLEIGTGSGYNAAILSRLYSKVYSIERIGRLSIRAQKKLDALEIENVVLKIGDGTHGWPEEGPFDAIIVTAAAAYLPPELTDQLAEGGKLIAPLGADQQYLTLLTKHHGHLQSKQLYPVKFVPFVMG